MLLHKQFILALGLLLCIGCNNPSTPEGGTHQFKGEYPLKVVATTGMVADLARNIGGEHVEVVQLMGPGVDPHLYKTSRDDTQELLSADIIFYSGLMLEGKMVDLFVKMARKKPVIAVTEEIDESKKLEPEDFAGHYDPHVWMDVATWAECVDVVEKSLSKFDPKNADQYKSNANVYRKKLEDLHQYGLTSIGSIPKESRVLVTSHDAFNYMGRAYKLNVQGVQGISTESEAGLQRINSLVDLLVKKNVRAVFIESSVSPKNINALVEGTRSKKHAVTIGGELFSDAMGEKGTYEGTYIGMLDHNITLVTRALGGNAPEKGMQGKLSTKDEK